MPIGTPASARTSRQIELVDLIVALVATLSFVWLGAKVSHEGTTPFDANLRQWIHSFSGPYPMADSDLRSSIDPGDRRFPHLSWCTLSDGCNCWLSRRHRLDGRRRSHLRSLRQQGRRGFGQAREICGAG